jgi:hypothetical protein
MRSSRYVDNFANASKTLALFDDLLDCPVIASRHNGDPRPTRIQRFTNRKGLDVESTRTE